MDITMEDTMNGMEDESKDLVELDCNEQMSMVEDGMPEQMEVADTNIGLAKDGMMVDGLTEQIGMDQEHCGGVYDVRLVEDEWKSDEWR